MKIYPLGYSSAGSLAYVDHLMQQENMLLIDTRYKPYSWKADWQENALRKRYGERYRTAGKFLGNLNYQGGPIKIADPERGIAGLIRYLREGHDLILLCQCHEYSACHRSVIVNLLLKEIDVEVIQPGTAIEPDSIMCLSVKQPFATWLSNPAQFVKYDIPPKTIENRTWNTHYRGPLLIHASMSFEDGDPIDRWSWDFGKLVQAFPVMEDEYVRGAIVGIAELVDVVQQSSNDWFIGPYGFVLANARPIEPIPYRGQLKLFPVSKSLVEEQLSVLQK